MYTSTDDSFSPDGKKRLSSQLGCVQSGIGDTSAESSGGHSARGWLRKYGAGLSSVDASTRSISVAQGHRLAVDLDLEVAVFVLEELGAPSPQGAPVGDRVGQDHRPRWAQILAVELVAR